MASSEGAPGRTLLDAHQHFWIYNDREYGWMGEGMDGLKRDFLPRDLEPLLREVGVAGTVAVQARRTLEETRWLLELAGSNPFIRGVVGWADFTADNLAGTLAELTQHPRLVGMRELIHDMPDREYALSREHTAAVRALGSFDLTYDLLLRPEHLGAATALADLFPEQPFVVDHIAKPRFGRDAATLARDRAAQGSAGTEEHDMWARGIREIARRPNVHCKLSGLLTELDWEHWAADQVTPYLDAVLEAFGPSRVMIGSDWPVCTCAADYQTTMGLLIDYASRLTPDEQDAVLAGTCMEFYGLQEPTVPGS